MVEIIAINVCGKVKLGRLSADAALRVLRRASFDSGKGMPPARSFHLDTIGAKGEFLPHEAEKIIMEMVA